MTQPRVNTLTVTWSPLPSAPTGLEEHYFYIIEIRKLGDPWSEVYFTQTFQHQADVTEYSEDVSMNLEQDTTYVVRLVGKRVHKDQEDRQIVSRDHEIHITCTGWNTGGYVGICFRLIHFIEIKHLKKKIKHIYLKNVVTQRNFNWLEVIYIEPHVFSVKTNVRFYIGKLCVSFSGIQLHLTMSGLTYYACLWKFYYVLDIIHIIALVVMLQSQTPSRN